MKLCCNCGTRPRHVSKSGQVMTRCHECLQAQWRKSKTPDYNGDRAPRGRPKQDKPKQVKERKPRKRKERPEDILRKELIESRLEVVKLKRKIRELEGTHEHFTRP
jgi:ribosome-binding protein aMBF1 (putative translation factor)